MTDARSNTAPGDRAGPRKPLVVSLIVAASDSEVYGGERSALAMLSVLESHRVHIVTDGGPLMQALAAAHGLPVTHVDLATPRARFRGASPWQRVRKAIAFLRDWYVLRRTFKRLGADVIHVNDISPAGQIGVPAAKLARLPCVMHVRTEIQLRRIHRLTLAMADSSVTVSPSVMRMHLAALGKSPWTRRIASRATALHNGADLSVLVPQTDTDRRRARDDLGVDPDAFVMLSVGSFEPRKRQHHLLENVIAPLQRLLPSSTAYFVGGTKAIHQPYLLRCDELRRSHLQDPARCVFVPYVDQILDYYAASDVVILGSLIEGLPRTVLEAMALARPVVATASPGATELIDDDLSGKLVDPADDGGQFAAALVELATLDPEMRARMGEHARAKIEREFDVRMLAVHFGNALDEVIGAR